MAARPLSIFYGYPEQLIARWCGVSVSTARLYKSGVRKPSRQALRLFTLHRDGRVLGDEWKGFAVREGNLVDPQGQEFTPVDPLQKFVALQSRRTTFRFSGSDQRRPLQPVVRRRWHW